MKAIKIKLLLEKSGDYYVLYINRGLLYSKVGNYQEALIDFTKAIELNPADANIYSLRGDIYLIIEDYTNAYNDYLQAIKLDSNNPQYYRQMALAYAIIGSIDNVKRNLELAEIKENKFNSLQNELGLYEFSTGYFQKAIDHFGRFIELNPHLAIGYQNRGATLYQAGNLKEAINDFDEAICLDPANADLYQMRAISFMSLPAINEEEKSSHLLEAQNNLLHALEINPNNVKICQNLAAFYFLRGNTDAAIEYYEKVLALTPTKDHLHVLKKLSLIYLERCEYEKSLMHCEKATQLGFKDGEFYLIQGHCFFETNQFEQAILKYDLAVNAGCDDSNVYFNRAQAYFCLRQFDQALSDVNRVLKANPVYTECYKLRGIIFLSMHKNFEAYSDFRMAINTSSAKLFTNSNTNANNASITEFTQNDEELFSQLNETITFLSDLFNYKTLFQSRLLREKIFIEKLRQIDLHSFGHGLVVGMMDGGVETLNEIGPFLANLIFHPIETTEELLTAIQFLFSKALEEEWNAIFEALAPELKELYSTWDKIEDYHKGKLTGLFIGKNGVAALTAIGAIKTLSKLKSIVICNNSKAKFSRLLKRMSPKVTPIPIAELPILQFSKDKAWHMPYPGGELIESQFYTDYTLARMVPDSIQNKAILEAKAIEKIQELGLKFTTWEEIEKGALIEKSKSLSIDPRGIPPSVIEAEIANPGSVGGKIEIILNEKGDIVTVLPLQKVQDIANTGSILIKTENVIHHVMQEHHHWEKVIKLSRDINEDFRKILKFIDDNKIIQKANINETFNHRTLPITVTEYRMKINGYEIAVFMENYLETKEVFLKNAYVITPK